MGNSSIAGVNAVLCVKNSAGTIRRSIASLTNQGLPANKIIVIDGKSKDQSFNIAQELGCKVLSDQGNGFVFARSLGINECSEPYTLILGPDDQLKLGSLEILKEALINCEKIAAVQTRKRVDPKLTSYFDIGMDYYYLSNRSGIVPTVGNPSLYRTNLLKEQRYDPMFSANEDTDWCFRVSRMGYSVMRSDRAESYEIEPLTLTTFTKRWVWYGEGDFRFICKYLNKNPRIAIKHFLHPAINYILKLSGKALYNLDFKIASFLFLCGLLRYVGIAKASFRRIKRKPLKKFGR
jgi:glycosyltransferase involved in cell wall biosynthesis